MAAHKNNKLMIRHGTSLELPLEHQLSYLTPVKDFFVCNSGSSPAISRDEFTLKVWGNGVSRELSLGYADLAAMAQSKVAAVIECAGNHRALFQAVDGKRIETPAGTAELIWSTGAVGMAEWEGVPLATVLQEAGVSDATVHVCATGSDTDSIEGHVQIPLPLHKAMHKDTLLALKMNGQLLTRDHGYPVRVLVPGWIGAYSVKWVQNIQVSLEKIWVRRNTESYVMMGEHWPAELYSPAKGMPLTELNIKSALALGWHATLSAGAHRLHGFARSPGQRIAKVEWRANGEGCWQQAKLCGSNEVYGWVRFEIDWHATAGEHTIMTRATDEAGRTQPHSVPFNTAGYLYNATFPHPIKVT